MPSTQDYFWADFGRFQNIKVVLNLMAWVEKTEVSSPNRLMDFPFISIISLMSEIVSNLWLGDLDFARSNKYDVVVNCTPDLPFFNDDSVKIRVPILDKDYEREVPKFCLDILDVVKRIDEHLQNGARVLVHCGAGQSRSPTVVACYLVYRYQMSVEAAIKITKGRHSNAFFGGVAFLKVIEYTRDTCLQLQS